MQSALNAGRRKLYETSAKMEYVSSVEITSQASAYIAVKKRMSAKVQKFAQVVIRKA